MSTFHAVVWMDHQEAHVLMFDREHAESQRIKSRHHVKSKHGHAVSDKSYLQQVAESLNGVHEVLLTGPAQAKIEFRDHCQRHARAVHDAIVDLVNSDHPSDGQLLAMAKRYFARHDAMQADPAMRG
jgi:stalled ribosome rescue protein Dom34